MWVGKYRQLKGAWLVGKRCPRSVSYVVLRWSYDGFLKRFSVYYIMTDQDIKDILDIEVKEPPRTPQLSKEAIMGTLKVNLGSGAL